LSDRKRNGCVAHTKDFVKSTGIVACSMFFENVNE
jgi:type III secretory pathway component EscU